MGLGAGGKVGTKGPNKAKIARREFRTKLERVFEAVICLRLTTQHEILIMPGLTEKTLVRSVLLLPPFFG